MRWNLPSCLSSLHGRNNLTAGTFWWLENAATVALSQLCPPHLLDIISMYFSSASKFYCITEKVRSDKGKETHSNNQRQPHLRSKSRVLTDQGSSTALVLKWQWRCYRRHRAQQSHYDKISGTPPCSTHVVSPTCNNFHSSKQLKQPIASVPGSLQKTRNTKASEMEKKRCFPHFQPLLSKPTSFIQRHSDPWVLWSPSLWVIWRNHLCGLLK